MAGLTNSSWGSIWRFAILSAALHVLASWTKRCLYIFHHYPVVWLQDTVQNVLWECPFPTQSVEFAFKLPLADSDAGTWHVCSSCHLRILVGLTSYEARLATAWGKPCGWQGTKQALWIFNRGWKASVTPVERAGIGSPGQWVPEVDVDRGISTEGLSRSSYLP